MWVIPPEQNADFVAAMEDVLGVYERPFDPKRPVVCFDEQPRQLIGEKLVPIPAEPGQVERYDSQYIRNGTVDNFMFSQWWRDEFTYKILMHPFAVPPTEPPLNNREQFGMIMAVVLLPLSNFFYD